ncbi:hypothetical protein Tco_0316453 [Tanacetum coccineum]
MTKVIKEEFEKHGLLEINEDLFTYDTQLGMIFNEFNRFSGINNDLFTYEIKVPKPTQCVKQTSNPTHNDLGEYEWKISYEECEKIYAEAVILINKTMVRLIDVNVEQWLDLKYGNHKTMDNNIKKRVIGTWLIRSYKLQFDKYLEIKREREIYAEEVDMKYNPSNLEFPEWLASKFYNHLEMDWYTNNALWNYWKRGDDEVKLTDKEYSNPNYENLIDENDVAEIFRIETNEYKNDWIYEWNNDVPWVHEKTWKNNEVWEEPTPVEHYCEPFSFKSAHYELSTCSWKDDGYSNGDGKLKDEALKNKAIMEGIINEDEESYNKAWRKWDNYENTIQDHKERDYEENNDDAYGIRRQELSFYTAYLGPRWKEIDNVGEVSIIWNPICVGYGMIGSRPLRERQLRSGVTTRIPEKLVCRRTYQVQSYKLRLSAVAPKEQSDKSTSDTYKQTRSASKSQKTFSGNKESIHLRRSIRLEDRSITKEKVRKQRSKSRRKRSKHQEASLNSEYEEGSEDAYEDLNSLYKRPKLAPFTQRITRFKYHRRVKLPWNSRYAKDPTEIHGIKRRHNEGLQAFMDWFKSESSHIKGVPLVLRISALMHGHGHPKLAKKLNDKIPKMVDEMFERVRAFIRGEVAVGSAEMEKRITHGVNKSSSNHGKGRKKQDGANGVCNNKILFTIQHHNRKDQNEKPQSDGHERPDQYVTMGATLTTICKQLLADILQETMEVFTWTRSKSTAVLRQIRMAEDDKEKTGFYTKEGVYCFTHMPKELKNSAATLQRMMEKDGDNKFYTTDKKGRNPDTCFLCEPTSTRNGDMLHPNGKKGTSANSYNKILENNLQKSLDYEALLVGLAASTNQGMKDLNVFIDSLTLVAQLEFLNQEVSMGIKTRPSVEETSSSKKGKAATTAPMAEPNYNREASRSNGMNL